MPIISNPSESFCDDHFVFIENDILIKKGSLDSRPLTRRDLPGEDTLSLCLKNQAVSDWFNEPDKNYCAMMLEKDSPVPAECAAIPLRQFFWQTKDSLQQESAAFSGLGSLSARAHGFLRLRQTYIHCPKCGAKLTAHGTLAAKVCPACGRLDFPRIEPAIIVLVTRGDEILLVKSKTVPNPRFSCIAGFVEHGESIEQTVEREVREEAGIEIKNIRYAGSQPWPFPDQLMLAFTAEYKSGQIKIQEEEIEEAAWFKRTELPRIYDPGSVAYNLIMGKFPAQGGI